MAPWITYVAAGGLVAFAIFEFLRARPDHPFRDARFTFFIFVLIPVQTLFAHVWLTVPYYLDRAFRGSMVSEYFEFFSNINPILIFILAPIVAGLTARANVYTMMIIGTLVMALPTFLLVIGPHLVPFLAYVLLMSIGEAMWQPRFLQWIAEVAPPGKTGLYMGIGQFPWFLTKFVTGLYSGYFVAKLHPAARNRAADQHRGHVAHLRHDRHDLAGRPHPRSEMDDGRDDGKARRLTRLAAIVRLSLPSEGC